MPRVSTVAEWVKNNLLPSGSDTHASSSGATHGGGGSSFQRAWLTPEEAQGDFPLVPSAFNPIGIVESPKLQEARASSGSSSNSSDDPFQKFLDYITGEDAYEKQTALQQMAQDFNSSEAAKARYFNAAEAQKARDYASSEAEIARRFNHDEAELNRMFQRDLSNTAYQRAAADMKAAGLNPYLVYAQGGAPVTAGSSASASAPSAPAASASSASVGATSAGKGSVGQLANTALSSIVSSAFKLGSFFQ